MELKHLFVYLEPHFLESELTVASWRRACGAHDQSKSVLFRRRMGCTLKSYLMSRRLETAARLLETTNLGTWKVGTLTGFASLTVFSRAFEQWSGLRPSIYRQRALDSSVINEKDVLTVHNLARALDGLLSEPEALVLCRHLLDRYPFIEIYKQRVVSFDNDLLSVLDHVEYVEKRQFRGRRRKAPKKDTRKP
jgi:AraC-like DNA-binding protein